MDSPVCKCRSPNSACLSSRCWLQAARGSSSLDRAGKGGGCHGSVVRMRLPMSHPLIETDIAAQTAKINRLVSDTRLKIRDTQRNSTVYFESDTGNPFCSD